MSDYDRIAAEIDDLCPLCGRDSCPGDCPTPEPIDLKLEGMVAEELLKLRARREARRRLDAELRDSDTPPEILSLSERLARPRSDVAWRIPGWQPAGSRVLLAGSAKSGKTHLVGNLVRALVDGDPWLGVEPVPITGCVGILDLEMSDRQFDEWLEVQRIRNADRVFPIPLRGASRRSTCSTATPGGAGQPGSASARCVIWCSTVSGH
jgi:hypothetical protein